MSLLGDKCGPLILQFPFFNRSVFPDRDEFLDRLVTIALPRVRDFHGVSPSSFDGRGNYALGLKEQIVFPEIDYDAVDAVRGLDIVIVTTARTDDEGRALLKGFNMPFTK